MTERDSAGGDGGTESEEFQRGSVVRLTMHNFLTYDDVTVHPGPQLNLVIGPNGSGKSSLVAALVLGLGGGPEHLGRAKKVSHFIKAGTDEACIELELFESGGNHVVTRTIQKSNKSIWMYGGKVTPLEKIKEVVARLNVQVGNLCQILPQEKVQEFVRMDAKGLLQGTERAVGYPGMADDHQMLQSADDDQEKLSEQIAQHTNAMENKDHDIATLQPVVDNQRKRQKYETAVQTLKQRRAWIHVDNEREKLSRLKTAKKASEHKLNQSVKGLEPLKKKTDLCKKDAAAFKLKLETRSRDLARASQPLEPLHARVEAAEEEMERLQRKQQERALRELDRGKRAAALRQKLQYIETELAQQEEVGEQLLAEISACETALRRLVARNDECQAGVDNCLREQERLHGTLRGLKAQLDRVQSVGHQRLELLRRRRDAYNAVMWLRQNADQFQHTVYEPIVLLLDMLDTKYARYVQAVIPFTDMYAFTCESRDDMNKFLREIRDKQKLRVSCVLSDPALPLNSFRPNLSRDQIRRLGFTHIVGELFNAPEAIRRYLYKTHQLHNIPVADVDASTARRIVDATSGQKGLNRFMVAGMSYSSGRSKYSGEEWVSSSPIGEADEILTVTTDRRRETQLLTEIAEMEQQYQAMQERLNSARDAAQDVARQLDQQRTAKQELTARRDQRRNLEGKRRLAQVSLRDCEAQACDVETFAAETTARVQDKLEDVRELQAEMLKICTACQGVVLEREAIRVQHDLAARQAADAARAYEEANAALEEERREVEAAAAAYTEQKEELTRQRSSAVRLCGLPDDDRLQAQLERRFSHVASLTLEEVEKALGEKQALAAMLGEEDGDALQRYELLKADRARVKAALDELTARLQRQRTDVAGVRQKWITALETIVENVDKEFSRFFKEMGCAGEVTLSRGNGDGQQAGEFGICVRVKFRAAEPLCELSGTHHSGGERSVATMLYIMALQQLRSTTVPFHVVDEINQGMDAQNERRVFDLVVRAACQRDGAQYFLITPKLLPNLKYPARGLTVLCVFNSPSMLSHTEWDLDTFIRRRRRLGRAGATP